MLWRSLVRISRTVTEGPGSPRERTSVGGSSWTSASSTAANSKRRSSLFDACLDRYAHVRQKVLLTDDDEAQRRFYESLGFVRTVDFEAAPLNAYVRFDG